MAGPSAFQRRGLGRLRHILRGFAPQRLALGIGRIERVCHELAERGELSLGLRRLPQASKNR